MLKTRPSTAKEKGKRSEANLRLPCFRSHKPQADACLHENPFLRLEGCNLRAKAAEEPQVVGRRRDGGDKTEQDREEE